MNYILTNHNGFNRQYVVTDFLHTKEQRPHTDTHNEVWPHTETETNID